MAALGGVAFFGAAILRQGEDMDHILVAGAALGGEELQTIAIGWQVAGRHHDGGVVEESRGDGAHEHTGGGGESAVKHLDAHIRQSLLETRHQKRAGQPAVLRHGDAQLLQRFLQLLRDKASEPTGDIVHRLWRKPDGLPLRVLHGHRADVAFGTQVLIGHTPFLL